VGNLRLVKNRGGGVLLKVQIKTPPPLNFHRAVHRRRERGIKGGNILAFSVALGKTQLRGVERKRESEKGRMEGDIERRRTPKGDLSPNVGRGKLARDLYTNFFGVGDRSL